MRQHALTKGQFSNQLESKGWRVVFGSVLVLAVASAGQAKEAEIDYAREIQPIFAEQCLECHGGDTQEGGFRFDRRDSVIAEAESGQRPIVPGSPARSELLRRVTEPDPDVRMPPEGEPLTAEQIRKLTSWIAEGARYSQHWAYRPVRKPPLPHVDDADWCSSGIDYFVLDRLRASGIEPSPAADRYTLAKRLYYDLLGLPPPLEAVDAFLRDRNPDAYERLVDRLLASPHFGERWGRHWLDKARYADSDGYEKDNPRPNAWHYRDWVIRAINNDMPFDRFTIEQLAGDLLPAASDAGRLATAFHRQTLTNTEGGTDPEEWRVAAVMDRTETLGTVWLGLTVGCARCHDHKYDDISQAEYYQLYAFFNNGDETQAELISPSGKKAKVRVISERTEGPRVTRVLHRGDFLQPRHEVRPQTLGSLPATDEGPPEGRLDLARWLMQRDNPLPARVAANHVWQHLFGEGLVRTANDFGIRGEPPTHPKLLDWLATEYVTNDWSRKHLVRTIVLSRTYRQASRYRDALTEIDPENRLLHRQNRFRVEAEVMRDIALAASGLLSSRIGGPSVFPPIPESITDLTYNSGFKWQTSEGEDRYRRGMYTFFKRTAPHPNLTTFDCPSSNVTKVRRDVSNTPTGALVTLNNTVYVEAARALARRVIAARDSNGERLAYLLQLCLARPARDLEISQMRELFTKSRSWYGRNTDEAKQLGGSARAPGASSAELAAWVATVRIALNLDEFITRE